MSTKDERGKIIKFLTGVLAAIILTAFADIHRTTKAIHAGQTQLLLTVTRLDTEQQNLKQQVKELKAKHISMDADINNIRTQWNELRK